MSSANERAVIPWSAGKWDHDPQSQEIDANSVLRVEAREGSDAWQKTSYGFVHANQHALLRPFAIDRAIEVDFTVTPSEQFDQLGLMLWRDDEHWIKCGIEFADGEARLGAVVTNEYSDWSTAAVPHWAGKRATLRVSWSGDAVTIRAGLTGDPLELVRLAPWRTTPETPSASLGTSEAAANLSVYAGPFCCAPTRAGFVAEFLEWRETDPDAALHS